MLYLFYFIFSLLNIMNTHRGYNSDINEQVFRIQKTIGKKFKTRYLYIDDG